MFIFMFTILTLKPSVYQTTDTLSSVYSTLKTENYSLYEGVDRLTETRNKSDQAGNHTVFNSLSKVLNQSENNDTRRPTEKVKRTATSFVTLNGTGIINSSITEKLDDFLMIDSPYYSGESSGWLSRDDNEGQVRFVLSKPQKNPYAVLLTVNATIKEMPTFIISKVCSGSLLTNKWVLTAASCFKYHKIVSDIVIYAGGRSLNELNSKPFVFSQTRRSSTYYIHPDYALFDQTKAVNDIALVKARKKFKLSGSVNTVKLLPRPWSHKGFVHCSVTGFGKVKLYGNDSRDYMRKTYTVSVKKPCKCFEKEKRASSWLCPNPSDNSGVCEGDIGSGLICNGELVGVTSSLLPTANAQYCSFSASYAKFSADCGSANMFTIFDETYPSLGWIKTYAQGPVIQSSRNETGVASIGATSTHSVIKLNLYVLVFIFSYLNY